MAGTVGERGDDGRENSGGLKVPDAVAEHGIVICWASVGREESERISVVESDA